MLKSGDTFKGDTFKVTILLTIFQFKCPVDKIEKNNRANSEVVLK